MSHHFELPVVTPVSELTPDQEIDFEHAMDTEGLSAYDARARVLGYYPVRDQITAPENQETQAQPDPETVERLQRLEIMHRDYGFYPTSLRELSESFSVKDFDEKRGGAAKHLAEIARHQEKHEADPVKAAISVTTEFGHYARQARTDATALMQLKEELSTADAHPFSRTEPWAVSGRGQLVRFMDLRLFAESQTADRIGFDPLQAEGYRSEQPNRDMSAHIEQQLRNLSLGEAQRILDNAIKDQSGRFKFWIEQVAAIKRHNTGASRVVAGVILDKLTVTHR
ncbi:MAG: hypothetical protein ABIR37_00550 [Candidatus Saccharimonadales bacterium]